MIDAMVGDVVDAWSTLVDRAYARVGHTSLCGRRLKRTTASGRTSTVWSETRYPSSRETASWITCHDLASRGRWFYYRNEAVEATSTDGMSLVETFSSRAPRDWMKDRDG